MKPKLFIGSSVEGLSIAYAVQSNLEHEAEVTVWSQGIFDLSQSSLESLVAVLGKSDFGIFVFTPDDIAIIRGESKKVARDNVLFELGLFIGKLGKKRCFILTPRGEELSLPTDLLGLTPAEYEPNRTDSNFEAATGPACQSMRRNFNSLGLVNKDFSEPQKYQSETFSNESTQTRTNFSERERGEDEYDQKNSDLDSLIKDKSYQKIIDYIDNEICNYKENEDELIELELKKGLYLSEIDTPKANQYIEQLIEKYPENHRVYGLLALTVYEKKSYKKAREILERGLNRTGQDGKKSLSYLKAITWSSTQKRIDELKALLEINPNYVEAIVSLCSNLLDIDQIEESLIILTKALKENPEHPEIEFQMAMAYYNKKDHLTSCKILKKLCDSDCEQSSYYSYYANCLWVLDFNSLANSMYMKADELAEGADSTILSNLGNMYRNLGLYSMAIKNFKLALEIKPESAFAHKNLGETLELLEQEKMSLDKVLSEVEIDFIE